MKKVLFVITKANFGGAQRYVYDLATSLPHREYIPIVALGGDGGLTQKLQSANIKTLRIKSAQRNISFWKDFALFFELLVIFAKEKPDILHLNSSKVGGIGAFVGRILFIPRIIFTSHGWAYNEVRPLWQKAVIRLLAWFTLLFSHKVIAVSHAIKKEAPGFKHKVEVIHNGISEPSFLRREITRSFLEERSGGKIDENAIVVGTLAELHPTKGLGYAIAIFDDLVKKYPTIHFVIFGEGAMRTELEKMVHDRKLEDTVHFFGFIDNASTYLKGFDLFLLPSLSEALSYALIEAGFASLPVIASRVGGIPEIIEDKKTGLLVEPQNMAQLQASVEHILLRGDTGSLYGENLRRKVEREFTKEQMVKKTILSYN